MLDNYSDNFDKAFIHKSWKELKENLDAELPTQKTTKKPWLMGLCLLQGIAIITLSFLWFNSEQAIPFTNVTKEKVSFEKVYVKQEVIVTQPAVKVVYPQQLNFNSPSYSNNQENIPTTYIFSALPTITEEVSLSNQSKVNTINNIPKISSLYSHPELAMAFAEMESQKRPFYSDLLKNSLTFGLGFTTIASNDLDYTGFGILGTLQYKFNNKFGLTTGIGFNRISREFLFVPGIPNSKSSYDVSPKDINLEQANTFYRSLSDMKQIYVPFVVNYNLTDKFALLSGLKLRYTYDSNIDRTLTGALVQKTAAVIVDPQNAYYNRANVGLALGISYSPNKHFSLDIDTEFGLGSIINKNQFTGTNINSYNLNLVNVTTNYRF